MRNVGKGWLVFPCSRRGVLSGRGRHGLDGGWKGRGRNAVPVCEDRREDGARVGDGAVVGVKLEPSRAGSFRGPWAGAEAVRQKLRVLLCLPCLSFSAFVSLEADESLGSYAARISASPLIHVARLTHDVDLLTGSGWAVGRGDGLVPSAVTRRGSLGDDLTRSRLPSAWQGAVARLYSTCIPPAGHVPPPPPGLISLFPHLSSRWPSSPRPAWRLPPRPPSWAPSAAPLPPHPPACPGFVVAAA